MVNEKKPITEEDHAEWREVVADVAPLAVEVKEPLPAPAPARQRTLQSSRPLPPVAPASAPEAIERGLLDRIAKGREPIEARLDLHGMTEAEAYQQFSSFIQRAYGNGMRTVLVITGKGRGGEGKLRRSLLNWLELDELRGYISGYHTARTPHGGEGAWYIRIRGGAR